MKPLYHNFHRQRSAAGHGAIKAVETRLSSIPAGGGAVRASRYINELMKILYRSKDHSPRESALLYARQEGDGIIPQPQFRERGSSLEPSPNLLIGLGTTPLLFGTS